MAQKPKPVHEVEYKNVVVAIWANQNNDGRTWFNTSIKSRYKKGDQWKESTTFLRDELLDAAKALDKAHDWIWKQELPAQSEAVNE